MIIIFIYNILRFSLQPQIYQYYLLIKTVFHAALGVSHIPTPSSTLHRSAIAALPLSSVRKPLVTNC